MTDNSHIQPEPPKSSVKEPLLMVRGNLVGLGEWSSDYMDMWVRGLQDPEVGLHSDGSFLLPSKEKETEGLEELRKNGYFFGLFALDSLKCIGSCGLFDVLHRQQTAMLGISILDKSYWGRGYGTEAVKLVLEYGFKFLNLHNITLDTTSFNERGLRAYQKAGFKLIGRRREVIPLAGKRYDLVYMDCLAHEFEPPSPGWFELKQPPEPPGPARQ